MLTLSNEEVQVPFEIVHRKVFTPTLNPVTPDVAEDGLIIVAEPDITVHTPVPTTGLFPATVALVSQTA